jgi:transcriptional regulator with XRE-family HTH domain
MTPIDFRTELKALGLTQRNVAVYLGLARSTVNAWATGKVPVPQYAVAWLELYQSVLS